MLHLKIEVDRGMGALHNEAEVSQQFYQPSAQIAEATEAEVCTELVL